MIPIKGINNFTFKSFKDYSTDENYFLKNNYFYGENGEGKSSLLLGIRKICESENIRYEYYSKDFVNRMILLEEDCLKGVKLTLGKENVQAKEMLQQKSNEKILIESQYNLQDLQNSIENDFKELEQLHTKIYNKKKGSTKIRKKILQLDNVDVIIQNYQDELNSLQSNFGDNILSGSTDSGNYEQALQTLNAISDLKNLSYGVDWENIGLILKTKFELLNIDHTILNWIEAGKTIYEKDIIYEEDSIVECPFCKSNFNITKRLKEINEMISNETKTKQDELNAIKSTFIQMKKSTSQAVMDVTLLLSNTKYAEKYNDFKLDKQNLEVCLTNILKIVDSKICLMNDNITFDLTDIQEAIDKFNSSISELNIIKKEIINENTNALNKINDIAKYKVAKSVINDTNFQSLINNIQNNIGLKKEGEQKLYEINLEIDDIKVQQSDVSDIAELINTALQHTNINIRLIIDNENYRLELKSDPEVRLQVENISEGEKGFIAFLYWYFKLFKKIGVDVVEELNEDIKVIIVDDPICSLDNKNNTYLITLLDTLIKHDKFQLFIAFHEWRDFINLIYGKRNEKSNPKHKFIEVQKRVGISQLQETKNNGSFYKRMYKEIYELSLKKTLDAEDVLRAPNYMRRCLETYLRFNYGIETATSNKEAQISEKLSVSKTQKAAFSTLLKVCNILSHGDAFLHEPSPEEVKNSVKCFITVMHDKDKDHHEVMIRV